MTQAILGKWGGSLTLRLPHEIASKLDLHEGELMEIEARADSIVIRRAKPIYAIDRLFAGRPPEEWRALYADAYDRGPDIDREIVED